MAVSQKVIQTTNALVTNPGNITKGCQTLPNPLGYFKNGAWNFWSDPAHTPYQKCAYLAGELASLNCLHPTEQTYRKVVGML
eukprot:9857936-Karenia_brevis.AAC.1